MLKEKSVNHRTPRKAVWVHHANTTNLHIYIVSCTTEREQVLHQHIKLSDRVSSQEGKSNKACTFKDNIE